MHRSEPLICASLLSYYRRTKEKNCENTFFCGLLFHSRSSSKGHLWSSVRKQFLLQTLGGTVGSPVQQWSQNLCWGSKTKHSCVLLINIKAPVIDHLISSQQVDGTHLTSLSGLFGFHSPSEPPAPRTATPPPSVWALSRSCKTDASTNTMPGCPSFWLT